MRGGIGNDTYYVADAGDWIIENETGAGINLIIVQGDVSGYSTDTVGGDGTLVVSTLVSVRGGLGDDLLVGTPLKDTIAGDGGNDTITGVDGADSLMGDAGNDSIAGGAGADTILGGADNDNLLGDAGADSILGGAGTDSIFGGEDNDTLLGDAGNDTIFGEAGNDSILGGADADILVAGTGTDTLLGEAGNDTLVADATGTASLLGGDDSDSFGFTSGAQVLANTVVGGAGTDTLFLTATSTVTDAQLVNVSGVEAIQASSLASNSITLGTNAQAGGVLSLFGGTSSDILSAAGMSSGNAWIQGYAGSGSSSPGDTLVTGTGTSRATLVGNNSATADNYYQISSASLLGNNSIVGGASSDDYLQITGFNDGLIITGGGNTITLGVTAQAKFGTSITLTGGESGIASGGDTINLAATTKKVWVNASARITGNTITAGSNSNTLIGGSSATANDLFIFTNGSHLSSASIVGGGGTDTLSLSANGQTVLSAALTGLSSIEVFDLAGAGNSITLGAISAGISTIVGGTGPNTIDAANYNSAPNALTWNMSASNGSDSLLGGANGNLFQIKNGANLQNSFIRGNTGTDTIQLLAGAQTLGDLTFSRITSTIEKFVLGSATNGNSLTLGTIAAGKGIATIIGGTSHDTIDASAFTSAITIDASASSGSRLIGSTANGDLNTLIGGATGGNEFVLGAISTNSLVGGSNGLDTLTLTQGGTVLDTAFTPISKIGTLKLEGTANIVTLGANALIAGIRTLVGGEGNDLGTGNSINTSAYGSAGVLFQVTDQDYLANITTLVGGSGIDTLKFSRDDISVTDENVDNLKYIDVIQTANGTNRFLMHDAFDDAGIDSIVGGTGTNIIDMLSTFYDPFNNGVNFDDVITFDMSAGLYSLLVGDDWLQYAKVVGGGSGGIVSITNVTGVVADIQFENLITLGEHAMASGLDALSILAATADVSRFNAPLVVNGGSADYISAETVVTSFAALAGLTFNGGGGFDRLVITDSEARAITSLDGDFDALVLGDGENFVSLSNDAGLSVIQGGKGADTLNFLFNTTGINFMINASVMGNTDAHAQITGGTGRDTISVNFGSTGNTFADTQLARVELAWAPNGSSFSTDTLGGNDYIFATEFVSNAIDEVYVHDSDFIDVSTVNRDLNFIFGNLNDFQTADIDGTDGTSFDDTLTLNQYIDPTVGPVTVTIADSDFAFKNDVHTLVLNSVDPTEQYHSAFDVALGATALAAGIKNVVGGNGSDYLDASSMSRAVTLSGGLNVRLGGQLKEPLKSDYTILQDTLIGGSGADSIYGDNFYDSLVGGIGADTLTGTSSTALGANEIDTLTGDGGNDLFVLGDASNAYYNTGARASDYALITDFAAGDKIQLKDLSALYSPTAPATNAYGYLIGDDSAAGDIHSLGLGVDYYYLYADTDKSGTITTSDNVIAAINSTGGVLTAVNATNFTIV
jgi:Ca2+-binding RTX toxin-like protein